MKTKVTLAWSAVLVAATLAACAKKPEVGQAADAPAASAAAEATLPEIPSPFEALPETVRRAIDTPFTGDLDEMINRRVIRVGVTYNRTHYYIDQGQERGITYEYVKAFEKDLNERLKTGNLKVNLLLLPMTREQLYPALSEGKVDMVAAMVTVRPEAEKLVAFSSPTRRNVSQVVVTGPGAPPIASIDDLAGQDVYVRRTSVYRENLVKLNEQFKARGKAPMVIIELPEVLEDDDILEMVNAGLVPITVVDDYLAQFWGQMFADIKVHPEAALTTGGNLAVAFRKDNPLLQDEVNKWMQKHGEGDAFRNILEKRYLKDTKLAKQAASDAEQQKLAAVAGMFRKYGEQYNLDYLLMAAQGYQESTLDHSVRSPVGAIGIMQVMPATGKEQKVGDITQVDANIHAGVKYMRFMMDQYFKDEPMDDLNKALMTFAAYNAGPGRLRQLRREAEKQGLDPNVWFGNVERVASQKIGRETVTYVSNIYKYYIAYRLLADQRTRRAAAMTEVEKRQAAP
ncbi:MAG: Membrane-bound lytic murein transglycosylase precursor [Pseudomonadota bacterium]|jgi:membrane-bound lytic murein transglycosylase MltF